MVGEQDGNPQRRRKRWNLSQFNYWGGNVALSITGTAVIVALTDQPLSLILAIIWGIVSGTAYALIVPRPQEDEKW